MNQKMIIYQVLPRLFGNDHTTNKKNGNIDENGVGKFSAFDERTLEEIRNMGFTHIWYTGVIEHATKTDYAKYGIRNSTPGVVKGNAGSPYAIRDYYDVSPDLADNVERRMEEFEALIRRTHAAGLKVIMDFVPNHVAREYFSDAKPEDEKDFGSGDDVNQSFTPNNNFYYIPDQPLELSEEFGKVNYSEIPAKVSGNDCFTNRPTLNDWYETVKLNYGVDYLNQQTPHFDPVPDTWLKMRDILIYWTGKGIDGFRCDMAEMVPVDFWSWVIPEVKGKNKSLIFIAEIYQPEKYHDYVDKGHFDYLYDKVGLYDTLRDVITGQRPASDISGCWQSIDGLQKNMVNFLENHDEQRIASDFFAGDPFKAIPAMVVTATMNANPVMVYAGQELGERGMDQEGFSGLDGRTSIFDYWSVATLRDWRNGGLYGGSKLSEEQVRLRTFYIRLLQLCNQEKAILEGGFYDLMYLNYQNPDFDPSRQYAFLRYTGKTFLLVVANFSEGTKIHVRIDPGVFSFMNIDLSQIKQAKELLSSEKMTIKPGWENTLMIEMKENSGKIIRFS
ncbi:MAG: alpha-amylase family protein [Bacteroidales bacterium]|jgi:glycosidase|nr:alpha-amylase family protein [Bacteroidales bacterium]